MQRLENPEAYQRFKVHEANVILDMQNLPSNELDSILSQRRRGDCGGIGSASREPTWLQQLEVKNGLNPISNTRYLLHGTKEQNLPSIFRCGLRTVYARESGVGLYGKGVYFTDSSCKANQYTGKVGELRHIFICRVILGRQKLLTKLDRDLTSAPDGYHSCYVNNTTENGHGLPFPKQLHNEFIIYNDIECYPEFLLTVRDRAWH